MTPTRAGACMPRGASAAGTPGCCGRSPTPPSARPSCTRTSCGRRSSGSSTRPTSSSRALEDCSDGSAGSLAGQGAPCSRRFIAAAQFDSAYRRSQGICVPHALQALQLGADATHAQLLVTRTLPKWAELRRDLQGFVDKHDYRNRRPFTEAESTAYLRAIEVLTGARGLFANDLRAGARAAHGARGNDISPDRPLERGAEDADFERG